MTNSPDADRHEPVRREMSRRTVLGRSAAAAVTLTGAAHLAHATASAVQPGVPMSQSTPTTTSPTVVFVHGAFADASGWIPVIEILQSSNIPVLAVANPLRGIASDSASVAAVVEAIPGPVLLVGHSYGGAVISAIPKTLTNVVGLVYVAAFAPDEGETAFDVLGMFPPTLLGNALRPTTLDADHPDVIIDPAQYHEVFAADLPEDVTVSMAVTQRPVAGAAFAEPAPAPSWKRLPSWYAVSTGDNAVGVDAERFYAERAGAITIELDASHVSMISQPEQIADLITTALDTLG